MLKDPVGAAARRLQVTLARPSPSVCTVIGQAWLLEKFAFKEVNVIVSPLEGMPLRVARTLSARGKVDPAYPTW